MRVKLIESHLLYQKTNNHNQKNNIMKLNTEELNTWINSYNNTAKLPNTKVPCSNDNCEVQTTMFGTNLHERVVKFQGIENLLTKFECKTCRAKAKARAILSKLEKSAS